MKKCAISPQKQCLLACIPVAGYYLMLLIAILRIYYPRRTYRNFFRLGLIVFLSAAVMLPTTFFAIGTCSLAGQPDLHPALTILFVILLAYRGAFAAMGTETMVLGALERETRERVMREDALDRRMEEESHEQK